MKRAHALMLAGAAVLVTACGSGTGLDNGTNVGLSFATRAATTGAVRRGAMLYANGADTIVNGTDTLVITSAQLVLREIKLERTEATSCETPTGAEDNDACESFEAGPVLVDLPLGAGAVEQVAVPIDTGSFDQVKFKVHRVSDSDTTFAAAHPDLVGSSIRVQGTFNGVPFTFTSELDVEQEATLNPPLVIGDSVTTTNLTIRVNLDSWFVSATGSLINPADGNHGGTFEGVVTDNIVNSMKAFEDRNHDGDETND